jgi:Holliday junction resolvase RusA-like endonuclease
MNTLTMCCAKCLGLDADPAVQLSVYGTPGPQGSKKAVGTRIGKKGKPVPILMESSAKVKPWRAAVAEAADECTPLVGALAASMIFTLQPPLRMPKDRVLPSCTPDLSKLLRSTEDALKGTAWLDDAQVVEYRDTGKYYPGQHPLALDAPGVVIRIWKIGDTP